MKYILLEMPVIPVSDDKLITVNGGVDFFLCPYDDTQINIQYSNGIPNVPQKCECCKREFGIKRIIPDSDECTKNNGDDEKK